jgi:divalent metal cation (Fe/Co/Zn/Cd) transporter
MPEHTDLTPLAHLALAQRGATVCADACCTPATPVSNAARVDACCATPVDRDGGWLRAATVARSLAWASLVWMSAEGTLGLFSGIRAGSIGLVGWALSSVVEGLASVIVIWRFTGSRTHSAHAERAAGKGVAISFWLLAPYIAVQATIDLVGGHRPSATVLGMALAVSSVIIMPALGLAKRRLGARLRSGATTGEGAQNLMCAYLAVAVLAGLAANAAFGWWWLDPIAGLAVATMAVIDGTRAWRGDDCCC